MRGSTPLSDAGTTQGAGCHAPMTLPGHCPVRVSAFTAMVAAITALIVPQMPGNSVSSCRKSPNFSQNLA
eukprot:COSAG04_NODE_203_length_20431_cov_12.598269_24_plen_70_part_00